VKLGPLIDTPALDKVERHVANALEGGAEPLLSGERHDLGQTFFQPTVLTGITPSMAISCEETFGPVAAIALIVGINTGFVSTEVAPFGGMKECGMGREGPKYGIEDWLELKYLALAGI
jgi:succinate-semialdehyde dehydrogenase / glutarate-semialdehyde dehydrogenase